LKPASSRPAPEPARAPPTSRRRRGGILAPLWDLITSLKLTIVCLSALMVLVVACTLAQVHLGTWGAVEVYMRSWLVWWDVPRTVLSVPVFPGGALAGLVLAVNLIAAQLRRLELSWRKSGLWVVHLGLILLVAGEFIATIYQREHQLVFENGQTVNYVTSPRKAELAVIDRTDGRYDEVFSFSDSLLRPGRVVQVPGRPIAFRVKEYYANSQVGRTDRGRGIATAGFGPELVARELPRTSSDDERDMPAAVLERVGASAAGGAETWLVSTWLNQPQRLVQDGRTYDLVMRSEREYLPYALKLKKFSHDRYPGTDIPKNFSSAVWLTNPRTGEARDVLIKMNQPLRYAGKTFYQASFQGENTSVLQVVQNPGWLLPYFSCLLVAVGLLMHFGISLRRWVRGQSARRGSAGALEAMP
jgi:hypothetical protein